MRINQGNKVAALKLAPCQKPKSPYGNGTRRSVLNKKNDPNDKASESVTLKNQPRLSMAFRRNKSMRTRVSRYPRRSIANTANAQAARIATACRHSVHRRDEKLAETLPVTATKTPNRQSTKAKRIGM